LSEPEPHITRLAYVSDLHINSTVALCPPKIDYDDGGSYHPSPGQRWLWECWNDFIARFYALPGRHIVGFGGDLGELDTKRRTVQIISPNKSTIQEMVTETIAPLVDRAEKVIFIRGTQAHEGRGAWLEEATAKDTDNAVRSTKKVSSWYHFQGRIDDVRFDLAHHASMGEKPANSANKLAEKAELYYYRMCQPLPNVVIRSHNHRKADSGDNFPFMAFFTPAFSLKTEFVYRIGKELTLSDIGGLIFTIDGDRVTYDWVLYPPKDNKRIWAFRV